MSAFIVSDAHINFLLSFVSAADRDASIWVAKRRYSCHNTADLDFLANTLRDANYASVSYRYQGQEEEAPQTGFQFYRGATKLEPLTVLKACSCFDYQACEVDNYEDSDAAKIINSIRDYAIRRLPGYDDAKGWSVD